MDERKPDTNPEKNQNNRLAGSIVFFAVMIIAAVLIWILPDEVLSKTGTSSSIEYSEISRICELATLECYYHDVAEYSQSPSGLFQYGLFQYGYKKYWLEYDGIVTIGIDVSEVEIGEPDSDGNIQIYIPDAKVLDVNVDEESMGTPIVETGVLTTVTTEEKAIAFSSAQTQMRTNAESDTDLLMLAKENAKLLIEQYIFNIGEQIGAEYSVEWVEE